MKLIRLNSLKLISTIISIGAAYKIFRRHLEIRRISASWIPHFLTEEQKKKKKKNRLAIVQTVP